MEANGGWTHTDHLLALNIEVTHAVMRAVYDSIPMKPGRRQRIEPLRVPRPGQQKPKKRRRLSPVEFLQRMKGG